MKKIVICLCLCMFTLLFAACGNGKSTVKESYGTFEYENADGSVASIVINKDEVCFQNVKVEELKNAKVEFEVHKEVMNLEKERNEKVDEKEKEEIYEKYNSEIDWSNFVDASFKYNAEYEEDSQAVYFESVAGNEYELYFSYNLKYKTLTIYGTEFTKISD